MGSSRPLSSAPAPAPGDGQFTFKVQALTMHGSVGVEARAYVATKEDAQAIAASFPKSVKIKGSTISGNMLPDGGYAYGDPELAYRTFGYVMFDANLAATGVTGARNETGLKRYRSFRRNAAKLGYAIEWVTPYANSIQTEDDFESHLQEA